MIRAILFSFTGFGGILRDNAGLREKTLGQIQKTCFNSANMAAAALDIGETHLKQWFKVFFPWHRFPCGNSAGRKSIQLWLFLVSLSATFRNLCAICRQNRVNSHVHFAAGNPFPIQVTQKFWDWLPCLQTGSSLGRSSCLLPVSYFSLRLACPTARPQRMRRRVVLTAQQRTCAPAGNLTPHRPNFWGSAR
ncbi:MAG: hypothetical protein ACSHXD_11995 [Marinosulfonomonas sp.]